MLIYQQRFVLDRQGVLAIQQWFLIGFRFPHLSTFLPPFAPRPLRRFLATTDAVTPVGSVLRKVFPQ